MNIKVTIIIQCYIYKINELKKPPKKPERVTKQIICEAKNKVYKRKNQKLVVKKNIIIFFLILF